MADSKFPALFQDHRRRRLPRQPAEDPEHGSDLDAAGSRPAEQPDPRSSREEELLHR